MKIQPTDLPRKDLRARQYNFIKQINCTELHINATIIDHVLKRFETRELVDQHLRLDSYSLLYIDHNT